MESDANSYERSFSQSIVQILKDVCESTSNPVLSFKATVIIVLLFILETFVLQTTNFLKNQQFKIKLTGAVKQNWSKEVNFVLTYFFKRLLFLVQRCFQNHCILTLIIN